MAADEAGLIPDENDLLDGIAFWMSAMQMGASEKTIHLPHENRKLRMQLRGLDRDDEPKPTKKRSKRNYKT
jgi:hypothetical protein